MIIVCDVFFYQWLLEGKTTYFILNIFLAITVALLQMSVLLQIVALFQFVAAMLVKSIFTRKYIYDLYYQVEMHITIF